MTYEEQLVMAFAFWGLVMGLIGLAFTWQGRVDKARKEKALRDNPPKQLKGIRFSDVADGAFFVWHDTDIDGSIIESFVMMKVNGEIDLIRDNAINLHNGVLATFDLDEEVAYVIDFDVQSLIDPEKI